MATITDLAPTGTLTFPDTRHAFRATVAEVAARAKARLPEAVNGRVERAVKLVLGHDVTPQGDGTIEVGSSTDPLRVYRLVGATCTCQDFTQGKAPAGWCAHRIAAGIQKRVQELLLQSTAVETEANPAPVMPTSPAVPPALPEAPASCNVYVTIGGHKVQVTLRDHDEQRMLTRLQVVLDRYPAPQPPAQAAPSQGRGKDWCSKHGEPMKENHKDGRTWYSHKTAEGWCKGR